jgi:divalent metal cation (Fe/Co/Zn/Cd) transporter
VYHGIQFLRHPHQLGEPTMNYIVLGSSIVFELISCWFALKEFNAARGKLNWWRAITTSKNPITFLVLFEDVAAVAGLIIVLIFTFFAQWLQLPVLDGVASILVGLLLGGVALFLGTESRSLLMGEGVAPETQNEICRLVEKDPAVLKVINVLSTYQSPEQVVLMLIVAFQDNLTTPDITTAIDRIRDNVKASFQYAEFVIIQPQTLVKSLKKPALESVK